MSLTPLTPMPTPPSRSSDNTTFVTAADAWVAAEANLVTEFNATLLQIPAQVSPANFNTVSTTSVLIGTGSKTLTVEAGKILFVGQWLLVASTASPSNYMVGQCTAYNGTTGSLTVNVSYISGSGTLASWTVGPSPAPNANVNVRAVTAGTTSGTITPDSANADQYNLIGLNGATTIAAPSGTPVQGQKLMLRIKDNGTSQTLTWNATYKPFGTVALPTATTLGKAQYVGLIYDATAVNWSVIANAVEQ